MEIYKQAMKHAVKVYQLSNDLPRGEDYGLTSQIRRSANSVCSNISEGFGRSSSADKNRFYVFARGSAFETQSHLIYGSEVGYFDKNNSEKEISNYDE